MNQCWTPYLSTASLSVHDEATPLPELYLCPLTDNALVSLSGEQSQSYLQGQLTCDMQQLDQNHYLNAAHCDAKGKMWAIMKTFSIDEDYYLAGHSAELAASLTQLNKYGVFSKTTITDVSDNWFTLGLGGSGATRWLQAQWQLSFEPDNNAMDIAQGKVLKLAQDSYMLIINQQYLPALLNELAASLYDNQLWAIQQIKAGQPHLEQGTIEQFVPQMLNLQCLDAISFDKGCYAGQEMVARMKYLGKNKRAAYVLQGHSGQLPKVADELQIAIGENWRRAGTIINVAGNSENLHILAVLPSDQSSDAKLRIKNDEHSVLTIKPLPYSLEAVN
jgi:folate-binding protein YgfZ